MSKATSAVPTSEIKTPTKEKEAITDKKNTGENSKVSSVYEKVKISPVADKIMQGHNLSVDDIINGLQRI